MKLYLIAFAFILTLSFASAFDWSTQNIIGYWGFNEGQGNITLEQARSVINLTSNGTPAWVPGILGTGTKLNGLSQFWNSSVGIGLNTDELSASIWVNLSTNNGEKYIYDHNSGITRSMIRTNSDGTILYYVNAGGSDQSVISTTQLNTNVWYNIIGVYNSTTLSIYINGVLENSTLASGLVGGNERMNVGVRAVGPPNYVGYINGTIDEFGYWNRTLSQLEIMELYNNGQGLAYGTQSIGVSVFLQNPPNGFSTTSSSQIFNATVIPFSSNLTNATFYMWHSNSNIFNITSISLSGNTSQNVSFTINNILTGSYNWNILGCSTNITSHFCSFAESNFTFTRDAFIIDSEFHENNVYETSNQMFIINISTIDEILSTTAILNYNGTPHLATTNCNSSGFCNIFTKIDIPIINSATEQKSFFWNISVFDGNQNINQESNLYYQNVSQILLYNCTVPSDISLNFTAYDEQNETRIRPFYFAGTFGTWLGTGTTLKNFSFDFPQVQEVNICLNPSNLTYKVNADIQYNNIRNSSLYSTRNYYLRNATLTNSSTKIPLYLLQSVFSTTFILNVQDSNSLPVSDVLIFIQRYYPGNNTYNTVQIAITDDNGQSVGFFETETVEYKFILVKNGQILFESTKQKIFPQSSPFTLVFRVGEPLVNPFLQYQNLTNLQYSLFYNQTTGIVSYTYIDTSGTTTYGRLLVQSLNPSGGPTTICNINSSQASATLLCNVTGYNGTIIAQGFISRSPEVMVALINVVTSIAKSIFGIAGLLMGFIIVLAVALITIYNPVVQIITVNVTIIGLAMVGLFTFSPIVIFGILAISTIILVIIRA